MFADPIADMLVRIRNAHQAGLDVVEMPHSKVKTEIVGILKKEGFVTDYVLDGGKKKTLRVYLKYTEDRKPVICGIRRESSPGLRRYVTMKDLPKVLGGFGVAIVSTSAGIMTAREAKKRNMGGEYICSVW